MCFIDGFRSKKKVKEDMHCTVVRCTVFAIVAKYDAALFHIMDENCAKLAIWLLAE